MKPHIQNIAHSHSYIARQRLRRKSIRRDIKIVLGLMAAYLLFLYIAIPVAFSGLESLSK